MQRHTLIFSVFVLALVFLSLSTLTSAGNTKRRNVINGSPKNPKNGNNGNNGNENEDCEIQLSVTCFQSSNRRGYCVLMCFAVCRCVSMCFDVF